ncbi:HAD-IC family P-type ATPase [Erysipelothrix rhusiopathiae]|nr:HAD-IC family P-type ATPase [Erysipelothrix rhusiopathiae]MDE8274467.1 HAD-IC family P-type ATPase [Erysipelothrix rhusiopathiae]MDE8281717.1 HAD-IC family P-type ATPase [Erysipelothrix rhusiopathiae]MDE8322644.1 HAD-IC family P-type ATPase [Erysipelothrix rhusiopathiae]
MQNKKGLTTQQVKQLTQEGKVNRLPKPEIKSNAQIIFSNVFTLFNLYNIIIASALVYVKAWTSLFFMGVIISNTFMFIFQEIRSRNLISKLNIIISPKTTVIRDGERLELDNEDIVLGDLVYYEAGNQISADARIVDGSVEVNESLLTGEVDPVDKTVDAEILSGSFIVSGACYAEIIHVGKDNYAIKVTSAVKTNRVISSELLKTFKTVTKITSFFIIPIGAILLYQGLVLRGQAFDSVIVNTATALLGMLPQGLVLLTTLVLIGAVLKLGSKKTLVQDLYAIETLSQSSVLCLDKTGTLTHGVMKVIHVETLDEILYEYMSSYIENSSDNNATSTAIKNYFEVIPTQLKAVEQIPFSSARKWAGMNFSNNHSVLVGAPDILLPGTRIPEKVESLRRDGARILLICESLSPVHKDSSLKGILPLAYIALEDPIRDDAYDAIQFFRENDVTAKVISGDNVETVAAIARKAGIENYQNVIDAQSLKTEEDLTEAILNCNVIGRATPNQKLDFVRILQEHGEKVAMTGDGINDVLALKNSDCSIAMGEGSDAALHISQIVVMDGQLSTLVDVVKEGRMVINNITRSASMYYLRTILTIFIAITAVVMNVPFPFIPFQITLTNMFIDGFPSFMLLFQPSYERPKERILNHVLRHAFPNAMTIILLWLFLNIWGTHFGLTTEVVQTMMYFINGYVSIGMIYRIYKPLNLYRTTVLIINVIGFGLATKLFWPLLELQPLSPEHAQFTAILLIVAIPIVIIIHKLALMYIDYTNTKNI